MINNQFTGNIPNSYANLTGLKKLLVSNNQLTGSLPDFNTSTLLEDFRIQENNFTFSDIEPQITYIKDLHPLEYDKQAPINESTHPVVYFDNTLSITPSLLVNPSGNDYYIWEKDTVAIEGTNGNRIYVKNSATQADEGCYSYDVNNSKVTLPDGSGIFRNLVLHSNTCIHAVYNHAPSVSNIPTTLVEIKVDSTYTYTPDANDADQDSLSFSIVSKPEWTIFNTTTGELTGTPTQSDIGEYNISLAVSDGKQITDINYTLKVLPKDLEPQTPVAPVNNSYKHSVTNNIIATALTNPQLYLYFDDLNERAMFIENNQCSTSTYHAYIGFPYGGGQLYTGYIKCEAFNQVFKSTVQDNLYPNGSTATLLNEPNTNKAMIMVDITLTDATPSVTIGAD